MRLDDKTKFVPADLPCGVEAAAKRFAAAVKADGYESGSCYVHNGKPGSVTLINSDGDVSYSTMIHNDWHQLVDVLEEAESHKWYCPTCEREVDEEWHFCPFCKTQLFDPDETDDSDDEDDWYADEGERLLQREVYEPLRRDLEGGY